MSPQSLFIRRFLVILVLSLCTVSCSQSPTGRSQFKLYSSNDMNNMGVQAFDQMKAATPATKNTILSKEVACIAAAIAPHVPKSVYQGSWEYVVFDDPQVNAFALPGGKVGVYTGLISLAQNSSQLAAVIGHEIGHVIAEHSNERLSGDTLISQGMQVASGLLNQHQVGHSNTIMAGLGLGVQMGVKLPFSRTHESEADIIGLELMAKAGFDPRQAIELWKLMDKQRQGSRQPEFLSTHPSPTTRMSQMEKHMTIAREYYLQSPKRANCD